MYGVSCRQSEGSEQAALQDCRGGAGRKKYMHKLIIIIIECSCMCGWVGDGCVGAPQTLCWPLHWLMSLSLLTVQLSYWSRRNTHKDNNILFSSWIITRTGLKWTLQKEWSQNHRHQHKQTNKYHHHTQFKHAANKQTDFWDSLTTNSSRVMVSAAVTHAAVALGCFFLLQDRPARWTQARATQQAPKRDTWRTKENEHGTRMKSEVGKEVW